MKDGATQPEAATALAAVAREEPEHFARLLLHALVSLVLLLAIWAVFGRLDIVASAQGRLVPATYVKIVQPADSGIVKEILVSEGQPVRAGEVLMRMDGVFGEADFQTLKTEYHIQDLALRRIDAELAGRPLARLADDPEEAYSQATAQHAADRLALENALAQERSLLEKARHDLDAAEQVRAKLLRTLPHYQAQEKAYGELAGQGFVGRILADEKARDRIEREQDLRAQEAVILSARAGIGQAEHRLRQIEADTSMRLRAERAETAARVEKLRQELAKQGRRNMLLELRAPQDGVVKDLATHTPGTVVSPGTILMTLVPDADHLRAEVWVRNDDIGFVRAEQAVKLKLATYPFQKYGMVSGRVTHISADAAEARESGATGDDRDALRYRALIDLDRPFLELDGHRHGLAAGMQVTAEIRLGDRTVLEYLLSPIREAFQESGRER